MGFATNTTSFVNTPLEKLIADLILGSQTLDKGVAQMLQGYRKEVSLNRFYVTGDNITAPPVSGKFGEAPNDSFNKDERLIEMSPLYWENEYNARLQNVDHKFLWTTGPDGMIVPSNELQSAIQAGVIANFNNELDRVIWRGDKAGATGTALDLVDGFEVQLNADPDVIAVAPATITAANVIAEFEKYIQAAAANNEAILELSTPSFVVPNLVLALYREAARALPNKGTDITDEIMNKYGGYSIIGVNGMSPNTILFGNVGGGDMANLKVAVWADSDRTNVEMARTGPLDDTFGVKVNTEIGCNYVYGKEIVYSKTVV